MTGQPQSPLIFHFFFFRPLTSLQSVLFSLLISKYYQISLVICLATNTIDNLILYLESEEEHALDS